MCTLTPDASKTVYCLNCTHQRWNPFQLLSTNFCFIYSNCNVKMCWWFDSFSQRNFDFFSDSNNKKTAFFHRSSFTQPTVNFYSFVYIGNLQFKCWFTPHSAVLQWNNTRQLQNAGILCFLLFLEQNKNRGKTCTPNRTELKPNERKKLSHY